MRGWTATNQLSINQQQINCCKFRMGSLKICFPRYILVRKKALKLCNPLGSAASRFQSDFEEITHF